MAPLPLWLASYALLAWPAFKDRDESPPAGGSHDSAPGPLGCVGREDGDEGVGLCGARSFDTGHSREAHECLAILGRGGDLEPKRAKHFGVLIEGATQRKRIARSKRREPALKRGVEPREARDKVARELGQVLVGSDLSAGLTAGRE